MKKAAKPVRRSSAAAPRPKNSAAAKKGRYIAARARGRSRANALREAGYNPGSSRSATAMGARIERGLGVADVRGALLAAGIDAVALVEHIRRGLSPHRTLEARLAVVQMIGRWMSWGTADGSQIVPAPPPISGADLIAMRDATIGALRDRGAGGPA